MRALGRSTGVDVTAILAGRAQTIVDAAAPRGAA
jgi:hypothetical protein